MANVWSFNTTIRNPERMENMLRALSEMEGVEFDAAGQEKFFGLQIKKRLYKPTARTLDDPELISAVHSDESGNDLDDSVVEAILERYHGAVDGAGRGRTAAGIMNRFGLCVALQARGPVVITPLGEKWLNDEIDDDELFTKFFLKWQYPNQIESGYSSFNIKPFVGVIALIKRVNQLWEEQGKNPVGLSKEEYRLFVPSLITGTQIEDYAQRIIEYRTARRAHSGRDQTNFAKDFADQRARTIFGTSTDIAKSLRDLRDYADSSVRYFRMSGMIIERGGDTHIDIARDKQVEIARLLETISPAADTFDSYEDYFNFISDNNSLELPWQNEADLQEISQQLTGQLRTESREINANVDNYLTETAEQSTQQKVYSLQESLNEVRLQKLKGLRHNTEVLDECISRLSTITSDRYQLLTARPSLDFEWYTTQALMVINDAVSVEPSFKIGDDGIPTGFRANVSDIECLYESFGMTVEVTLTRGRDQWYAEGQPVPRHLRDFEDRQQMDNIYCLFVAPFIHRDSLNTFWNSNKHGFEGTRRQNIIPLTIGEFIDVLTIARQKIADNSLDHDVLHSLLRDISAGVNQYEIPAEWVEQFASYINSWR
jgi:hypothetical protein